MRKLSSILTMFLVLCLTVGGVSAAWVYSTGAVEALKDLIANVTMGTWDFSYTISFINNGSNLIDPITVTNNSEKYDLTKSATAIGVDNVVAAVKPAAEAADAWIKAKEGSNYTFSHWINAGSTRIDSIPAGNTEDVTLYPAFEGIYTAIFVDQDGNVLSWDTFTANTSGYNKIKGMGTTGLAPTITDFDFVNWEVHETNDKGETTNTYALTDLSSEFGKTDITIYPVYQYKGTASLTPVDSDGDGDTDYYEADGYTNGEGSKLVEIPNKVNGIKVTTISADAFSSYDELTAVKIPENVNIVEGKVFSDSTVSRQTVTLYYEGTPKQWEQYMTEVYTDKNYEHLASSWDYGMGDGSRVFFLDEQDNVINTCYWELEREGETNLGFVVIGGSYVWRFHNHPFSYNSAVHTCSYEHSQNDTVYTADSRVDQKYWIVTEEEKAAAEAAATGEETTE